MNFSALRRAFIAREPDSNPLKAEAIRMEKEQKPRGEIFSAQGVQIDADGIVRDPRFLRKVQAASDAAHPWVKKQGHGCPCCGGEAGKPIVTNVDVIMGWVGTRTEETSSEGHCRKCMSRYP